MPSTKFRINQTFDVQEQVTTEDFQDGCGGGHLGYCNKTILISLNLHVAPMPLTILWLILNYILKKIRILPKAMSRHANLQSW